MKGAAGGRRAFALTTAGLSREAGLASSLRRGLVPVTGSIGNPEGVANGIELRNEI